MSGSTREQDLMVRKIMRTPTEIRAAIALADVEATDSRTSQSRRLMAHAVADALRWTLGEEKDTNVARTIINSQREEEGRRV